MNEEPKTCPVCSQPMVVPAVLTLGASLRIEAHLGCIPKELDRISSQMQWVPEAPKLETPAMEDAIAAVECVTGKRVATPTAPPKTDSENRQDAIMRFLGSKRGTTFTVREIATEMRQPYNPIFFALSSLAKRHLVTRVRPGAYRIE